MSLGACQKVLPKVNGWVGGPWGLGSGTGIGECLHREVKGDVGGEWGQGAAGVQRGYCVAWNRARRLSPSVTSLILGSGQGTKKSRRPSPFSARCRSAELGGASACASGVSSSSCLSFPFQSSLSSLVELPLSGLQDGVAPSKVSPFKFPRLPTRPRSGDHRPAGARLPGAKAPAVVVGRKRGTLSLPQSRLRPQHPLRTACPA